MASYVAKSLFMAFNQDGNDPISSHGPSQDKPSETPYIPGGFPKNGLPTKAATVILIVTLFLASLCITVGTSALAGLLPFSPIVAEVYGFLLTVWYLIYVRKSCHATKGLMPILLVAGILLTVWCGGSVVPCALLLSVFMVISYGSMLMAVAPRSVLAWVPAAPIAATALALVLCQKEPLLALMSLFPWPTAVALAVAISRGTKKRSIGGVGLMCLSTLTVSVTGLIALACFLLDLHGEITIDILMADVESVRLFWTQQLTKMVEETIVRLTAAGVEYDPSALALLRDQQLISGVVNSVLNVLPGTLLAIVNVLSFVTVSALTAGLRSLGYGPYISREISTFRMSPYAAATFLIAFFVTLFLSEASTLVGTVAENIQLIFTPGLAFCGFGTFMGHMLKRRHRGAVFVLLLVVAAVFATPILIMGLAMYGASATLFSLIAAKISRGNPQNPNQTNS